MTSKKNCYLIYNISQLITFEPLVREKRFNTIKYSDLGIVDNSWLLIENDKFISLGTMPPPENFFKAPHIKKYDAQQKLLMPGLID